MKLDVRLIAAAVALLGSPLAHAEYNSAATGNGSLVLTVFNTVTKAAYYRDLGYLLNDFLPSTVTTAAGDGGSGNPQDRYASGNNNATTGTPITGTRTPADGLQLDKTNSLNFAGNIDTNWATYLSQNTTVSDLRWTIAAGDSVSVSGTNQVSRYVVTSSAPNNVNNQSVTNSTTGLNGLTTAGNWTGVASILSTGNVLPQFEANLATGDQGLGLLDGTLNVYYYVRSQGTLANSTLAAKTQYLMPDGSAATFTLASNGDVVYAAPAAVPLPAAAWLFGSGLLGLWGMSRRRRAA